MRVWYMYACTWHGVSDLLLNEQELCVCVCVRVCDACMRCDQHNEEKSVGHCPVKRKLHLRHKIRGGGCSQGSGEPPPAGSPPS